MACRLQLLAGGAIIVPVGRELVEACFRQPRLAIRDEAAARTPGDTDPVVIVGADGGADVVIATALLAELLGEFTDVGKTPGVELRPIVQPHDDVGTGTRLNRGGDARLDVVGVYRLDGQLDAEILLALFGDLALQQHIGGGHEIGPAQPVNRRRLAVSGSPSAGQDASQPTGPGCERAGARQLSKPAAIDAVHRTSHLFRAAKRYFPGASAGRSVRSPPHL